MDGGAWWATVAKSRTRLFMTPHQVQLTMGFPRQEYWSKLPFPSPGDLSNPGIKSASPAWQVDSLPLKQPSFSSGSVGKESACHAGDLGSILELGRFPRERNGSPLQYPCLENPYGQKSPEGCHPWGRKESDTTERLSTAQATWEAPSVYRILKHQFQLWWPSSGAKWSAGVSK